jgi:O-acetylhomoserine/O-acetylserine sulfhydrylase-like pyridoxal-dependent enzyme
LFDLTQDGDEVIAFQMERETPNATSVRFTLTPAPAVDSIQYVITDGTEAPDLS